MIGFLRQRHVWHRDEANQQDAVCRGDCVPSAIRRLMRSQLTPPLFLGDFETRIAGVIDRGDQKLPLLQELKKVAVSIDLSRCERPGQSLRRGPWSWVTGEPLLRGGGIQRRLRALPRYDQ